MVRQSVVGGVCGLFLGVICAIGAMAVSSIVAFTHNERVDLPGIFSVWTEDSDGVRGLLFDPSSTGLVAVVAAASLFGVLSALYFGRSKA